MRCGNVACITDGDMHSLWCRHVGFLSAGQKFVEITDNSAAISRDGNQGESGNKTNLCFGVGAEQSLDRLCSNHVTAPARFPVSGHRDNTSDGSVAGCGTNSRMGLLWKGNHCEFDGGVCFS